MRSSARGCCCCCCCCRYSCWGRRCCLCWRYCCTWGCCCCCSPKTPEESDLNPGADAKKSGLNSGVLGAAAAYITGTRDRSKMHDGLNAILSCFSVSQIFLQVFCSSLPVRFLYLFSPNFFPPRLFRGWFWRGTEVRRRPRSHFYAAAASHLQPAPPSPIFPLVSLRRPALRIEEKQEASFTPFPTNGGGCAIFAIPLPSSLPPLDFFREVPTGPGKGEGDGGLSFLKGRGAPGARELAVAVELDWGGDEKTAV